MLCSILRSKKKYFDLNKYLNPSLATSLIAFSGVISNKLTPEPLYMPRRPSFLNVLAKQSILKKFKRLESYIVLYCIINLALKPEFHLRKYFFFIELFHCVFLFKFFTDWINQKIISVLPISDQLK